MSLKTKLILAQSPLAAALIVVAALSGSMTVTLGERSATMLADNYRSVRAAQRMKDALERIDSHTLFVLAGRPGQAAPAIDAHRQAFEGELRAQEANLTEAGEAEATRRLRESWSAYAAILDRYLAAAGRAEHEQLYFEGLDSAFQRVRRAAEEIQTINQDAMARKSARAEESGAGFRRLMLAAVIAAMALGLLGCVVLTTRILRPLAVVAATVRRFGAGDPRARAAVSGGDEIGRLASEFNTMAEHLERFRASSLGELLAAQQAARAAVDALPDPVLVLGATGDLQIANEPARTLLGIDEDSGHDPLAQADAGIRALLYRLHADVLTRRGPSVPRGFEDVVRIQTTAGEAIFLPRATPIYSGPTGVGGVAVVLQEVTRLYRFDELRNNLLATVAHELRTPLTSLRMAIHLCAESGSPVDRHPELLLTAREDCERLQAIVDHLLDIARIESGRIDLQRRRVPPSTLVDVAVEAVRPNAESRGVVLRADVPPGCPEVMADAEHLQLVFTNLLGNAVRYSPDGAPVIIRAAPASGCIRFEIVDRGPGIAPEHQRRIFEKFFRIPGSPEGGSGLGLFIARGVIDAHGGRIGVNSSPESGATFWFTVPAASSVPSVA